MDETIGLLGNGGQADEVEAYLISNLFQVSFRAVSEEHRVPSSSELINILDPQELQSSKVIAAVGAPALKKKLVGQWPGTEYLTLVSDKAIVDTGASIGKGSVVAQGAVITTNVTIGDHVLVNIGATVSHNCKIGSFVTISPGVHIAGNVEIGEGVFVGIGATISNNIKIATGSVIGAGTVVLEDIIAENSVVVGVPGRVIKNNEGWLSEI